jgi:hypothetical protein
LRTTWQTRHFLPFRSGDAPGDDLRNQAGSDVIGESDSSCIAEAAGKL